MSLPTNAAAYSPHFAPLLEKAAARPAVQAIEIHGPWNEMKRLSIYLYRYRQILRRDKDERADLFDGVTISLPPRPENTREPTTLRLFRKHSEFEAAILEGLSASPPIAGDGSAPRLPSDPLADFDVAMIASLSAVEEE